MSRRSCSSARAPSNTTCTRPIPSSASRLGPSSSVGSVTTPSWLRCADVPPCASCWTRVTTDSVHVHVRHVWSMSLSAPAPVAAPGTKAFLDVWRRFIASFPGGWYRDEPGLIVFRSGAWHATSNGVVVTDDDTDAARVLARLDEVAEAGSPYAVQGRAAGVQS